MLSEREKREAREEISSDVVRIIPALRTYARSLARSDDYEDLVQETLTKALANSDKYRPGTNLRAWLFTIMRNSFYTNVSRRARERTGASDCVSSLATVPPTQEWNVRGNEIMKAVADLPDQYREMLILVVMLGESYETSAQICNCAVGTVKSRVNRARNMVIAALGPDALDRRDR
jgi:RNA polymerase sigma-70 factor (ECF subfamily)